MVTFTPAKINANTWWQVTEGRVDKVGSKKYNSGMFVADAGNNPAGPILIYGVQKPPQYWQFQPIGEPGMYQIRSSKLGIKRQFSVCYNKNESDDGKTGVCMKEPSGEDEQIWQIDEWDNTGTYRFINKANGTDRWMDIHENNPIFMSPNIDTDTKRPSQHWFMSSAKPVDESDFSTVFTNINTVATSTSSKESSPSASDVEHPSQTAGHHGSKGLSSAASAGIGIGVAIAVILLAVGSFLVWRKKRKAATATATSELADESASRSIGDYKDPHGGYEAVPNAASPPSELPPAVHDMAFEAPGQEMHHELDASPIQR